MIHRKYQNDTMPALTAQELAHFIAFGPVVFQVARIMLKEGIFAYLRDMPQGATVGDIVRKSGLSEYAVKVLMESSLTSGTVLYRDSRYFLSKTGWFILTDPMVKVNMDFNHDINYKGMFHLDEALKEGYPAGLAELGQWNTIYEGLSQLAAGQKSSWFGFDHFYSDSAFDQALPEVFASRPSRLMDIGGNTGKWAFKCVGYDHDVRVTVVDLPGQIGMLVSQSEGRPGFDRIDTFCTDILDQSAESLPSGYDVVWMSQFLDCFSEDQVVSILSRAVKALNPDGRIYIMETVWDRQKYAAASFDLAQTSVYFTAMANGNSKMFNSEDLCRLICAGGLEVERIVDGLGYAHSLFCCKAIKTE